MKFLSDYCVQEIVVPGGEIISFDYSNELNLIASFQPKGKLALVWNPETGKIVQEIKLKRLPSEILFLSGHYIAVTWDEGKTSGIDVYSVDSGDKIMDVKDSFFGHDAWLTMALTPENKLVVGGCFREFSIDLIKKTVVDKKEIYEKPSRYILCMCCSKYEYTICFTGMFNDGYQAYGFYCLTNLDHSPDGKTNSSITYITYCIIKGKRKEFQTVSNLALAHDGENIIVATEEEIIVLESVCEGSIGHVIVSSGIPSFLYFPEGRTIVNHKDQLMVCDGSNIIKVYEYKRYDTLQEVCRHRINTVLKQNKVEKVSKLPLPNTLKNYLMYKA